MKLTRTTYHEAGYDPAKPDNNVSERVTLVALGLSSDRYTLPPDGATYASLHYAGPESVAVWRVNGQEATEQGVLDPASGLYVSELEVTASFVGTITCECNGYALELEARHA